MKKTLLFLTFAILAASFTNAQNSLDVNLGDFEDDATIEWTLYGETYEIVDNPLVEAPNTSQKVLQNVTINQYQGMSLQNLSYVIDSFAKLSFDVYNAGGPVNFIVNVHGKTADGADVTASYYPSTLDGEWLHYEASFDGAEYETHDTITQIDLQNNTAETELYWDNILLTSKYEEEEEEEEEVGPSAIQPTRSATHQLMLFPNPASSNDLIRISGNIENNSVAELYNVVGQLKLIASIENGLLKISSLNSGLYFVKVGNSVAKLVVE